MKIIYKFTLLSVICIFSFFINIKKDLAIEIKESQSNESIEKDLNILMVGDIMTDRHVRKMIDFYKVDNFISKYLNNMAEVNSKYDYVVANLEGPITDNKSKTLLPNGTYGQQLIFTLPTSTAYILSKLNVKVVSLANNHTDNFYYAGYKSTQRYLDMFDIKYFGNPYNSNLANINFNNKDKIKNENISNIICKNDICVAYIGYHQFTKSNSIKIVSDEIKRLRSLPLISNLQATSSIVNADVSGSSAPDFIVVMPHWGVEYATTSSAWQVYAAHAWIDAGADMVVGAHPHVIQNHEIYKGKDIYYSLGNYIFDQWTRESVKHGLAINIKMSKIVATNTQNIITREIKVDEANSQKVFINREGIRYE